MKTKQYLELILNNNSFLNFRKVSDNEWWSDHLYKVDRYNCRITVQYLGTQNGSLFIKQNPLRYLPRIGSFTIGQSEIQDIKNVLNSKKCKKVQTKHKDTVLNANFTEMQNGCKYYEYKNKDVRKIFATGSILGIPNETGSTFEVNENYITSIKILGQYAPNLMKALSKAFINRYGTTSYDGKSETFRICTTQERGTCVNSPGISLNKYDFKYRNSLVGHIYTIELKTKLIPSKENPIEQMKERELQYNKMVIDENNKTKGYSKSIDLML